MWLASAADNVRLVQAGGLLIVGFGCQQGMSTQEFSILLPSLYDLQTADCAYVQGNGGAGRLQLE